MKRVTLWATALAVCFCLSGLPLMAQARGGGGGMSGGNPDMGNGPQGPTQNPGMGNGPTMGPGSGPMNGGGTNTENGVVKPPTQIIAQNPKLASKIQPLLPSGTNPQAAENGFKSLGEFVASVHVAHNLNLPFDQLKNKVVGRESLGKAIHQLNPSLSRKDTKEAIKKARQEAKNDIRTSHTKS